MAHRRRYRVIGLLAFALAVSPLALMTALQPLGADAAVQETALQPQGEPQISDAGPWRFSTGVERKSVSQFLAAFEAGSISLSMEINDGRGPSNETSVANLGYLKIRNGNIVRIDLKFAKQPDSEIANVNSLDITPVDPVEVAPGLSVVALKILPDATVKLELERTTKRGGVREVIALVVRKDEESNLVFTATDGQGIDTRYRLLRDGGLQVLKKRWLDLTVSGQRVRAIPLAQWPPTLPDLMSWLPAPKSSEGAQRVSESANVGVAAGTRQIPISKVEFDFLGKIEQLSTGSGAPFDSIEGFDMHINGRGYFDGATLHVGAPNALYGAAETKSNLNSVQASFSLIAGDDSLKIPLVTKIEGTWQASVPFYDLDSISAAFVFQVESNGSFALPRVEESDYLLAAEGLAEVGFNLHGRTTLGKRTSAEGRDLTVQLDDSSRFSFRIPGPIKLELKNQTAGSTVVMPVQTFLPASPGTPMVLVRASIASRKYIEGLKNAVRLAADCDIAFKTAEPIAIRRTDSGRQTISEVERGMQIQLKTGVEADFGIGSDDEASRISVRPSAVAWQGGFRDTLISNSQFELRVPGRIGGSGVIELKAPYTVSTPEIRDVQAKVELELNEPGGTVVMHFPSKQTLRGAIQPNAYLKLDSGSITGKSSERPGEQGWTLRLGGGDPAQQAKLSVNMVVQSAESDPGRTVLTGEVGASIELDAQGGLMLPSGGFNPYDVALGFAGTISLSREDSKALPGLQRILFPLMVSGQYQGVKREEK